MHRPTNLDPATRSSLRGFRAQSIHPDLHLDSSEGRISPNSVFNPDTSLTVRFPPHEAAEGIAEGLKPRHDSLRLVLRRPWIQFALGLLPSPTGFLHLGSARTALFNWAYARSQGGEFQTCASKTPISTAPRRSTNGR